MNFGGSRGVIVVTAWRELRGVHRVDCKDCILVRRRRDKELLDTEKLSPSSRPEI
jgi:hypothetical protein